MRKAIQLRPRSFGKRGLTYQFDMGVDFLMGKALDVHTDD